MNDVRLNPWKEDCQAPLPPGDSDSLGAVFNSLSNKEIQKDSEQDLQLFRNYSKTVILLNKPELHEPFRHLHKTSSHDPEIIKVISDALKSNNGVFQRCKNICEQDLPYWFCYNDLNRDIHKIIGSLYLRGIIGSTYNMDIEPFHAVALAISLDFRLSLMIPGELNFKRRAFEFLLPFYAKVSGIAKMAFEKLGDSSSLQDSIQTKIIHLGLTSFDTLKEADLIHFSELDSLFKEVFQENKSFYISREIADDYELSYGEKHYKIPKGTTVIFPCTHNLATPCPGFHVGIGILKVLFLFLLMKGRIVKETKNVWGAYYVPTTKTTYSFKLK